MDEAYHAAVTEKIGGKANYGKGFLPNPYYLEVKEYKRRHDSLDIINEIGLKITSLTEPRFITNVETSELLERLATMVNATNLLELGSLTGVTSLHLLRSIIGKPGAKLTSIDCNPEHDEEFFNAPELKPYFRFIEGWTPQVLEQLNGEIFDFVFIDSNHSLEHSQKELEALLPITRKGTLFAFHDVPEWIKPEDRVPPPIRGWLLDLIKQGHFTGIMLPSPRQLDCEMQFGADYPTECSPGLAVLIRN